ncbi:MAG: hypothetical protein OEZ34_15565, partial [Spirochaetia bacterium]|nr:hypothetical protein [Spirochaetia bacterium]
MQISNLKLKLFKHEIGPELNKLFRHGNEIRATVVRGGSANETAVLKSGRSVFQAKIDSGFISENQKIYLKVEKINETIKLIILNRSLRIQFNPADKGIDLTSFHSFIKFLG